MGLEFLSSHAEPEGIPKPRIAAASTSFFLNSLYSQRPPALFTTQQSAIGQLAHFKSVSLVSEFRNIFCFSGVVPFSDPDYGPMVSLQSLTKSGPSRCPRSVDFLVIPFLLLLLLLLLYS